MGSAKMKISGIVRIVAIALALFPYNASAAGAAASQGDGPQVLATVNVPAGPYIRGSDAVEREYGYEIDERAYGHSATRKGRWYAGEYRRSTRHLPAYRITATPITNAQYVAFIAATDHPAPDVDIATWRSYRLNHSWKRTRRHVWPGGQVPDERIGHPVVLVSRADASAYAVWLSRLTGMRWCLATEEKWEKAARGTEVRRFPWGGSFDAARLNSHDSGPYDTMPWILSGRGEPVWYARCRGSGVRMGVYHCGARSVHRQRWFMGRQRMRCVPAGGTAQPPGRYKTYPDRLPSNCGTATRARLTVILSFRARSSPG